MSGSADGLNADLAKAINQLSTDNKGVGINEGFRTRDQQQERYNTAVKTHGEKDAANWAAKPGTSNHEHGDAVDLSGYAGLTDDQLAKYGLYRPMSWEPWHVELIGSKKQDKRADQSGPVDPAVHDVMSTFQEMLGIGAQPYVAGVQGSAVAGQSSSVGADVTPGTVGAPEVGSSSGDNIGNPATGMTGGATVGGGDDLELFMAALSGQESGGNYDAKNARTGAKGRFQIMPDNWPAWSKEAGLPSIAEMTPENQDLVAKFKLQQYYEAFGNWRDVAIAWYGGPGAVNYSEATKNRKQGGGKEPSINEYADSVVRKMDGR